MPEQRYKPNLMNELASFSHGDGETFIGKGSLEVNTYEGTESLAFKVDLECKSDPELDGKVFNNRLNLGKTTIWSNEGLQLYSTKPTEQSGLSAQSNFNKYWKLPCLEAAKGTEFEKLVMEAFSTGDLNIFSEFEFVAKAVPMLDQKGVQKKSVGKESGKTYDVDIRIPAKFIKLGKITAKSGAGVKGVPKTVSSTPAIAEDEAALTLATETLTAHVGKSPIMVKTKLKAAGLNPDEVFEILADLGFAVVSGKLVAA